VEAIMKHDLEMDALSDCPVERTAHLLGDEWTILIVRDLMNGARRFGQLQDSLGNVSPKTLSHRLKMLENADILTRRAYAEIPPRVEYTLTDKGRALCHIIDAMRTFGEQFLPLPQSA
jgi:DNA-binding HxlR family transcriptional regulator